MHRALPMASRGRTREQWAQPPRVAIPQIQDPSHKKIHANLTSIELTRSGPPTHLLKKARPQLSVAPHPVESLDHDVSLFQACCCPRHPCTIPTNRACHPPHLVGTHNEGIQLPFALSGLLKTHAFEAPSLSPRPPPVVHAVPPARHGPASAASASWTGSGRRWRQH